MSDHEAAGPLYDLCDLGDRPHDNHSLGLVLRPCDIQRCTRSSVVCGGVARRLGWHPLLPHSQFFVLLHPAYDSHIPLLHPHMGQSLETHNSYRYEGCADGEDAAEIQGESSQDVGSCRYPVRVVLAAVVRDLRKDQAWGHIGDVGR